MINPRRNFHLPASAALFIAAALLACAGCKSMEGRLENPRFDTWAATWDTYKRALKIGDFATVGNCLKEGDIKQALQSRLNRLGPEALKRVLIEEWKDVQFSDEHAALTTDTFVNIAVNLKPLVGAGVKKMYMIQRVGDEWKIAFSETLENPPGGAESEK